MRHYTHVGASRPGFLLSLLHLLFGLFFDGFWGPAGGVGGVESATGERVPALVFFDILP